MRSALLAAAVLFVAGCVTNAPTATPDDATLGSVGVMDFGSGVVMHNGGTKGALSYLHLAEGADATITFPEGVLVQDADMRLVPATEPIQIANGELVSYLPPYGLDNLTVTIDSAAGERQVDLQLAPGEALVSGELTLDLIRVMEAQFPHRMPGHESYDRAMAYYQSYFEALGYDVEVSAYPSAVVVPDPTASGDPLGGPSLNSVVAYKRGTDMADRYVVFGGHFDVVSATTHGAFDNTGGTMAVLALAKAFANVTTSRTIVFAAWGGEEDCICGSQAWVTKHAELLPFIDLYVNYDVSGMAYPVPLNDPSPVVIASGPDQANTAALHEQHRLLEATWLRTGAEFVYEPIVMGGQVGGAGVNAQSDHMPFMSRGIPVVFQFPQRVDEILGYIHSEKDTLSNMTRWSIGGPEAIETELTPEETAEGEAALARSFETQMVAGFYWAVLMDAGVVPSTRATTTPPVALLG